MKMRGKKNNKSHKRLRQPYKIADGALLISFSGIGCSHGRTTSWVPENPVVGSAEIQVTISSDHALDKSVYLSDPGLSDNGASLSSGVFGAVTSATSEVTHVVAASSFFTSGIGGRTCYSRDASGNTIEIRQISIEMQNASPDPGPLSLISDRAASPAA